MFLTISLFHLALFREECVEDYQSSPDTYCHVGNIEGGVVPVAELDIDEINDETESYAVSDVARDTPEDQGQSSEHPVVGTRGAPNEEDYQCPCKYSYCGKTQGSKISIPSSDAERDTGISRI